MPPKPFQRPSIDMTNSVSRQWRHVPARDLKEGDVIGGKGLVNRVAFRDEWVDVWAGLESSPIVYRRESPVWAFN